MNRCPVVVIAIAALTPLAAAWVETAMAQDGDPTMSISDSLFTQSQSAPVYYATSYDRNVSRGTWDQTLAYNRFANRVSFGADAYLSTSEALQGLRSDNVNGGITGKISLRATNRWIVALDGRFTMTSDDDDFSSTDRRQNRLQLRTQYTANPLRGMTASGVLFTEFIQEQGVGNRTIPNSVLRDTTDASAIPPVVDVYTARTARDSSYTSGRREGLSGTVTWSPTSWLDTRGLAVATRIRTTTHTESRDYWAVNPGEGATLVLGSQVSSDAPNGDQNYEANAAYKGLARTTMTVNLKSLSSDQQYYALNRRGQEHLVYGTRTGTFHMETMPIPLGVVSLDATLSQSDREYALQRNLNSLVTTRNLIANFSLYKPKSRVSLGMQVGNARNDKQVTQNGKIISRSVNAGGGQRITPRLWLDATGSVSLYSRQYVDSVSDRDDVRAYLNTGGGYRVSAKCSTAVHFSATRSHAVAIDPSASAGNNVQTIYQMDAALRVQPTPSFSIIQYYQLNASYQIYDFDEPRNTLTRIRRIDTFISDSLFSFAYIRLMHNFFFQDRGSFTNVEGGDRKYAVASELYQQNLSVTVGVSPLRGITLTATQSLSNTRQYFPNRSLNVTGNRWNLNLGATVDREIAGDMTLRGSVQHIGEYGERPEPLPSANVVDYWIAGATFTKDF